MPSATAEIRNDSSTSGPSSILGLVAWVALSFSASLSGVLFSPGEWYASLQKPAFNPPGWIFGPVWTTLYFMMGVSAWLVWRSGGFSQAARALTLFVVQLALNAIWTPVFFGLHNLGGAFCVIVALWCAIALTLGAFWKHNRLAAAMLMPYLLWVSFATLLNFTLWRLN